MQEIMALAKEIVEREGGFVNDPDDPGGATKHGVTLGTLQGLGADLNRDGAIDVADVHAITPDWAAEIYVKYYFYRPGIDRLPSVLWPGVFDMYVNAGANAIKILQQLLTEMGQNVAIDGAIGPKTAEAGARAASLAPRHSADAYGIARRNYYFRLADQRAASRKFARSKSGGKGGWIKRAEAFITPRYHLSEAEFRARVASWG